MGHHHLSSHGYVVSDLHIFGCSSLYTSELPSLYAEFSNHAVVIFNGDTFDFKRSMYGSSLETAARAVEWLGGVCRERPNTTFHYILGNHDCHVHFTERLAELASSQSNLIVSEDVLRLGPSIFLHGDVIDLRSCSEELRELRARYSTIEPSLSSKLFAGVVSHLRLNIVEYIRHRRLALAATIYEYLESKHPTIIDGATAVYFGHTHVPFRDIPYKGLLFNNTGSLIRGLQWLPLECEV